MSLNTRNITKAIATRKRITSAILSIPNTMITTTMTTVMVPTAIPATDTEAVTDITESTAVTAMVVMDFRDMVAFMEEAFTD